MLARCDAENGCNCVFEVKQSSLKQTKIMNDVKAVYFECPECHVRYIAYYTNTSIRKLQKAVQRARGNPGQYNKLQPKLKAEMQQLKLLIEGK